MAYDCERLLNMGSPSRRAIPRGEPVRVAGKAENHEEPIIAKYRSSLERMGLSGKALQVKVNKFKNILDEAELLPEGCADDLHAMLRRIEEKFPDSRNEDFITYPLPALIIIIMLAISAGRVNCKKIREYIQDNIAAICALLGDEWPGAEYIPSKSTIYRALRIMGTGECYKYFNQYFAGGTGKAPEVNYEHGFLPYARSGRDYKAEDQERTQVLAADGQEVVGSYRPGMYSRKFKMAHVTTMFCTTSRTTVGFDIRDEKNHERPAIVNILGALRLNGYIAMADALNTTPAVAEAMLNNAGGYLLPIKCNGGHEKLNKLIKKAFELNPEPEFSEVFDVPKNHGRIETVTLTMLSVEHLKEAYKKLKEELYCGLKPLEGSESEPESIPELERFLGMTTVFKKTKVTQQIRVTPPSPKDEAKMLEQPNNGVPEPIETDTYYICSLPYERQSFISAAVAIDSYWLVEGHHYILDCTVLRQDEIVSRSREFLLARVTINKVAVEVLSYVRAKLTEEEQERIKNSPKHREGAEVHPESWDTAAHDMESFLKAVEHWHGFMEQRRQNYKNGIPEPELTRYQKFKLDKLISAEF